MTMQPLETLVHSRMFFDRKHSKTVPVFIFSILFMLLAFFVWAATMKMDDVVKAQALLRPVDTISIIRCLAGGEVQVKQYHQNAVVSKGDLLFQLDTTSDTLELEYAQNYHQQLSQDIRNSKLLIETIQSNAIQAVETDIQAWTLCSAYLGEYKQLQGQYEQAVLALQREQNLPSSMQTEQKLLDYKMSQEQARNNRDTWRNTQLLQAEERLKALTTTLHAQERKIADLERAIRDSTIVSPISGKIDETRKLNVGDTVFAGEEILRIIPETDSSLKAEIVLDATDIARIQLGQTVYLRFPGLPPSKFGQVEGVVSSIPADVTIAGNNATFVLEADLHTPFLTTSDGERIQLRPGVGAEGRIVIDRDSVLRMILRKLDFLH